MTNSVKTLFRLEWYENNALSRSIPSKQKTIETTSGLVFDATQVVGTTHEVLAVGDVTDDAVLIIDNLHATATVQIGIDDSSVFVPIIDIPAGYPAAVLPIASSLAGLYLKSSAANTSVRVAAFKIVAP
jgi:hypothetical protein